MRKHVVRTHQGTSNRSEYGIIDSLDELFGEEAPGACPARSSKGLLSPTQVERNPRSDASVSDIDAALARVDALCANFDFLHGLTEGERWLPRQLAAAPDVDRRKARTEAWRHDRSRAFLQEVGWALERIRSACTVGHYMELTFLLTQLGRRSAVDFCANDRPRRAEMLEDLRALHQQWRDAPIIVDARRWLRDTDAMLARRTEIDAALRDLGAAPLAEASRSEVERRVRTLKEEVKRADAVVVERSLVVESAESEACQASERSRGLIEVNPSSERRWNRIRQKHGGALPRTLAFSPYLAWCRRRVRHMSPSQLSAALDGDRRLHGRLMARFGDVFAWLWLMWWRVPRLHALAAPAYAALALHETVCESISLRTRGFSRFLVFLFFYPTLFGVVVGLAASLYVLAFTMLVLIPAQVLIGASAEVAALSYVELWITVVLLGLLVLPSFSWPSFVVRRWVLAERLDSLVGGAGRDLGRAHARRERARAMCDRASVAAQRAKRELELTQKALSEVMPPRPVPAWARAGHPARTLFETVP